MKYCCESFESRYSVENNRSPNIRVVRYSSKFLIEPGHSFIFRKGKHYKVPKKRKDIGFFITMGYDNFKLDMPQLNINFCPFCGTNLHEFYDKDEYANEIEGETFKL